MANGRKFAQKVLRAGLNQVTVDIGFAGGVAGQTIFATSRTPLRSESDLDREIAKVCELDRQGINVVSFQRDPIDADKKAD